MTTKGPEIQLVCNVVIRREDGKILLAQYGGKDDPRWWLPYYELVPYEHPDLAVSKVLENFGGMTSKKSAFKEVESFRGRSGWHVMFNYLTDVSGKPNGEINCEWFSPDELPQTPHGKWEKDLIQRALASQ
jgi:hypothetical protein